MDYRLDTDSYPPVIALLEDCVPFTGKRTCDIDMVEIMPDRSVVYLVPCSDPIDLGDLENCRANIRSKRKPLPKRLSDFTDSDLKEMSWLHSSYSLSIKDLRDIRELEREYREGLSEWFHGQRD